MYRRILMSMAAAALVAGCSSPVKLDDVPVEDKRATAVTPSTGSTVPGGGSSTGPSTQSQVAPVDVAPGDNTRAGPANVGRTLYFDYDSFVIKPEFQSLIEAHARFLRANASRRVALEGHTDERGGREYNLALGQKRSEAVRRALGLLGVADNQMEPVSFGEEKPAVTGGDEASLAQNRRVEIAYR